MKPIKKTDRKKAWAKRHLTTKRERRERKIHNLFRIYCEGENTEPEYFKSFPVNTETQVFALGLGRSRTSLVEKVIELLEKDEFLKGQTNYDEDRQLWCVFDFDIRGEEGEREDFNNAISLAHNHDLKVAYSNDAFELWLVLHYQYQESALTRHEYYKILTKQFGINYEKYGKTKEFAQSLYLLLLPNQEEAIQNAIRLHDTQRDKIYCDQNPCTTVYELVMALNECIKK